MIRKKVEGMNCSACGNNNLKDSNFCSECGASLPVPRPDGSEETKDPYYYLDLLPEDFATPHPHPFERPEYRPFVRQLLLNIIIFFVVSNVVLAALTFLMFYLGGVFAVFGWIIIAIWIIWDWRLRRQIFRLLRGDMSL